MSASTASAIRQFVVPIAGADSILAALPVAVLALDADGTVMHLNPQAEEFFGLSATVALGYPLSHLLPTGSPVFSLIETVQRTRTLVGSHELTLSTLRTGTHETSVQVAPLDSDGIVLFFHVQAVARQIDQKLAYRDAARSTRTMAAMLAHEVKNPLSGIRGAAQLLEQSTAEADRPLLHLIVDETDRIVGLLNRMEAFSDERPLERSAVNIHDVLDRVRTLAQSGFASHIRFVEQYDPSLPPVHGNRDLLVQVLLNLVKNAAEACPDNGGQIILSTAYQHGLYVTTPEGNTRQHVPLVVSVQDNGCGIPDDVRPRMFDPFVTTKANGSGLGLALVARIIERHGGAISCENQPGRTQFTFLLPMIREQDA